MFVVVSTRVSDECLSLDKQNLTNKKSAKTLLKVWPLVGGRVCVRVRVCVFTVVVSVSMSPKFAHTSTLTHTSALSKISPPMVSTSSSGSAR